MTWGASKSGKTSPSGSPRISDVRFATVLTEGRMAEQTVIGKGIVIRGSLSGGDDLVIEGRVEGQINLKNHLTIEGTGNVQADIRAEELTINGEASGNIDAGSRVAISASAKGSGDIKAPRVVIDDGAVFNGSIEMEVKLPDDI